VLKKGQVASVIAPALGKNAMYISVHLDMKAIANLHLEITKEDVASAIKHAPKLKISVSSLPQDSEST
jgi:hypothetical protein